MFGIWQRRMLRNIIGWRRHSYESWETTMHNMKAQFDRAMMLHYCRPWEECILQSQWKFANFIATGDDTSPWNQILTWNPQAINDPSQEFLAHRQQGRPRHKWDHLLKSFTKIHCGHTDWIAFLRSIQ
eukprot:3025729-Karenia_brevis.AAC.1